MKTLSFDNSAGRLEWMTPIAHINDIKDHVAALENRKASKPADAVPIALWVIALLFGAAWMAVPLYFVG